MRRAATSQAVTLRVVLLVSCLSLLAGTAPSFGAVAGAGGEGPAPPLPEWRSDDARRDRYVSVHGLRAFAGGYSEDGLELWTFPLQLASGYAVDVVAPDGRVVPGIGALASVRVDPLALERRYAGDGFALSETIDARERLPGVRVRYRLRAPQGWQLRVRLRPSLDLMWPAGIGGQEFGWDGDANGFELKEPSRRFRALIASPQATAHTEPNNDRRGSAYGREIAMDLAPAPCGAERCATLVFAGQSERDEDAAATLAALLAAPAAPAASDLARYDPRRRLAILTPDAGVNRALRWAQVALEHAWTCNARLGCGLVAGYGPSHGARRPQYAWYFAGDGLVATRALIDAGGYARAAEELAFILRYQQPGTGMIWHEMSHSAGFLDWAGDYDYMYAHVDIAFDFIDVLAAYDRASADDAFLRAHWPGVLRAWRYCLSTLDPGDGLPRVPAGKMSHNEQDRLTDELTLSAAWVRAAEAMGALAAAMDDARLADEAKAAATRARAAIRVRYRDEARRRWISGFTHAGQPGESFLGADLAAIASGAADPAETAATLDAIASPAYLTGWGLRSKPSTAPDYDPEAYSRGSVWGLGTAAAAEALWRAGRADTAWRAWRALVPWAAQDSLGHMHEVQSGEAFVPQRESVPEQTWSSAAFVSAAIGGLLGLDVDARTRTLRFAPQPPPAWRSLRVERIRIGAGEVDLAWRRDADGAVLEIDNRGPPLRLVWRDRSGSGRIVERTVPSGRTRL